MSIELDNLKSALDDLNVYTEQICIKGLEFLNDEQKEKLLEFLENEINCNVDFGEISTIETDEEPEYIRELIDDWINEQIEVLERDEQDE